MPPEAWLAKAPDAPKAGRKCEYVTVNVAIAASQRGLRDPKDGERVGDEGLSNAAETLGNPQVLQQRGAKSGAVQIHTTLPTLATDLAAKLTAEQRQQLGQLLQVGVG